MLKYRDLDDYKEIKFIIFPDDSFKVLWDIIIMFIMLYTVTITPYRVAFIENDSGFWLGLDYTIDCIFMCDVVINCFVAYKNNEEVLIVRHWPILKHYLSTWMLFDLASSIPFQIIFEDSGWGTMLRLSKLPRLYRLIKVFKLVRLVKVLKNRNRFLSCLNCLSKLSIGMERLVYFTLSIFVICHLLACFLYFGANFNADNTNNWVFQYGIQDLTLEEKYLASLYWTVTSLCTVGYGDIKPASDIERGIVVFVELAGVFFYSYTIGTITSLMSEMDKKKALLERNIKILQDISSRYNIPRRFYEKLKSALEYNQQVFSNERNQIISNLPKKLALQLNVVMNKTLIDKNKFFKKKQLKFIATVLDFLKPLKVKNKETVYRKGEFTEDIYLVQTGEIELMDKSEDIEITLETYGEGDYFGDVEVFLSDFREFSTRASKSGELFTLSKEALFSNILFYFEDLKLKMILKANDKRKAIIKKKEAYLSKEKSNEESKKNSNLVVPPEFERKEYAWLRRTLAPTTRALLEEKENDEASVDVLKVELDKIASALASMESEVFHSDFNVVSASCK